jgi:hypothetical protein
MRPKDQSTSPSGRTPSRPSDPRTPPNAFSPEYLAEARDRDESLTAAEAEFAGPWKVEPVPDCPGWLAVLRVSESLAEGDVPEAVFREKETAFLCAAVLPLIEREPLFHLGEAPEPDGELPGGYPVVAVHGEQGPQVSGWLRRFNPGIVQGLHLAEGLNRAPAALAVVLDAAGAGALAQVGRALAALRKER